MYDSFAKGKSVADVRRKHKNRLFDLEDHEIRITKIPARKPAAKRAAARNGRAKYDYYVVDKLTGLVHAGNEFREDAVDERKAMIEEGVPAGRVAVMTAASVRSKFGAIKWGTGRPDVRAAAKNGKGKSFRAPRGATNSKTVECDLCHGSCYPGEAYNSLANTDMPFASWRCLDERQCRADSRH